MRRKIDYRVCYRGHVMTIKAATPGAAARQAFGAWIAAGTISRQPPGDGGGGWDGVTITPAD